jgi:hypothetical protein
MRNTRACFAVACSILLACRGGTIPPIGNVPPLVISKEPGYFPRIPADSEFDTTLERSDQRRLIIGNCPKDCHPGPLASIQPRVRAASWSAEHRDSGEVIARIISEGPYPKFNIHGRDTVYWAVVMRDGKLVSVFRSTASGARDVIANVQVITHDRGFFRGIAFARWLWSDTDDLAWGTCDGAGCCKSDGIAMQ